MEKVHFTSPRSFRLDNLQRLQRSNGGQVGIIMLLITVVMLTVGISAVSRTTSDVNISTTNEQANRALDAAESDVEKALSGDLSAVQSGHTTTTTQNGGTVNVATTVTKQQVLETSVDQGNTVGVDMTSNNKVPITINWSKSANCSQQAALVITIFNFSGGSVPQVRRYYADNPTCGRANGFDAATVLGAGTYRLQYRLNGPQLENGDELMRIRPLYTSADIQVSGPQLPTQSYSVKSVAQNNSSKETKAVEVNRTLPIAPTVLDYVLFSGTTISQ